MNEDYHLQVQGERRGPYTLRQIDHMLNTGLIPPDALFLREGMEDWHPVTDLVALRQPVPQWKRRARWAAIAVVVLLVGRFFGPTVVEGWRETSQKEFTAPAAYWSARDAVRHQALPQGALVKFHKLSNSQVQLQGDGLLAQVHLGGEILGSSGQSETHFWDVELSYNNLLKLWTGSAVKEQGR